MSGVSSETHSNPASSVMGLTAASSHQPTTSSTWKQSRSAFRPIQDRNSPSSAPLPAPTEITLGLTATGWTE
eukprot:232199-Prymnesium_polylepis.1